MEKTKSTVAGFLTKTGERGAGAETGAKCSISGFLGGVSLKP
jgi:hypothetical protein